VTRAFLNAFGVVSALGNDAEHTYANMMAATSPGMVRSDEYSPAAPCWIGRVAVDLHALPRGFAHYESRANRLSLAALEQIDAPIRAALARYGAERVGVVLGTSTSGISNAERVVACELLGTPAPEDYDYRQQKLGAVSDFVASVLEVDGPSFTLSTACSSSAHALAAARRLIDGDVCDAVVAGGTDSLARLTVRGFQALSAVSEGLANPLSLNRDGINIGEGAALFLVSRAEAALELLGAGASSDAYHISAPDPDGRGAYAAMAAALDDARLDPSEIDYINLHGTGTRLNDAVECVAVERLFGTRVAVSSTKRLTGHALGAAGAIELALCCLALEHGDDANAATPPHCWDGVRDPALPNLPLSRLPHARRLRHCLSNSFAFGGNNAALVVGWAR